MYGFRTSFRTFDSLGCDFENVECLKREVYYCNIYRTGRFIGEDFILAIGDLFNFSPIFKTPTKYIRYDTLVHPDVIRQSKIRQML